MVPRYRLREWLSLSGFIRGEPHLLTGPILASVGEPNPD